MMQAFTLVVIELIVFVIFFILTTVYNILFIMSITRLSFWLILVEYLPLLDAFRIIDWDKIGEKLNILQHRLGFLKN